MPLFGLVRHRSLLAAFSLVVLCGCGSYKQNVMFKLPPDFASKQAVLAVETTKNYVIQVNDYLKLEVYSNKGERIIDPNGELMTDNNGTVQNPALRVQPVYLVTVDGTVKFPMIDPLAVLGMTIREAEQKLQSEYNKYYKECYVILTFSNKRVIVLGAPGGQVIPLANENISVVEVLALAKGIGNDGKAHNIRLIRGQDVYEIDFSTLDGLRKGNMIVQPGDIVYVEPVRRPFVEGSRDVSPLLGLTLSLTTLIIVYLVNN
ncbi:MAG TPA: polysaccharide biosynthesis/export family protein [Cyclobacteriaceae bacterium]|nr:polysaccharide biosynthesis/export family protein [Cyclobacteriaceae bacterium]